jgi:hypothetical protein
MLVNLVKRAAKMYRLLLLAMLFLLSCGGCSNSESRLPTFAVTGQVLQNNKPVPNATVVLHPVNGDSTTKPRGKTDAQGNFKLTTYDLEDGAPSGEYLVTVEQWLTTNPEEGPKNRLPSKFSKPESSLLTAKVDNNPNNTLKLELP